MQGRKELDHAVYLSIRVIHRKKNTGAFNWFSVGVVIIIIITTIIITELIATV